MSAQEIVRRLEELIPHASEGDWEASVDCFDDGVIEAGIVNDGLSVFFWDDSGVTVHEDKADPWGDARKTQQFKNALYIACASPDNLKTLIAYVRELEKLKDYALAWHPRQPGSTNDLIEAVDRYREFRRVGDE